MLIGMKNFNNQIINKMAKKKLKSKAEFKDDLSRLTVLKDRLNEILSRFTRMNEQEQKEVAELKEEINQINKQIWKLQENQ